MHCIFASPFVFYKEISFKKRLNDEIVSFIVLSQ
jgi:hypothetical protein